MTNQGRGRENSNLNFGQTLNQLLDKLSLDKSNSTSDISYMWPRDHFSFEIGKSEGVSKALMLRWVTSRETIILCTYYIGNY